MMTVIKELIEKIGGRERLEFIAENAISRERIIMARALLAVLDAQENSTIRKRKALLWLERQQVARPGMNEVRYAIELITTPPTASAPDGYKLVPIEPSKEMLLASKRYKAKNKVPTGPGVYRAMIAAAPATGVPYALREAVNAIYFTDSSDYFSALWSIVRFLSPETADLLAKDERAAFERVNANLQHAAAPVPEGDGG